MATNNVLTSRNRIKKKGRKRKERAKSKRKILFYSLKSISPALLSRSITIQRSRRRRRRRRGKEKDSERTGEEGEREGGGEKKHGEDKVRDGCPPVGGERNPLEAEREQADERCKVSLSSTSAASLSRALIRGEGFSRSRGDALPVLECVCDLARTLNALLSRAWPHLSLIHARCVRSILISFPFFFFTFPYLSLNCKFEEFFRIRIWNFFHPCLTSFLWEIEIDENFILRYIFSREYSAKLHLYSKYICCKKEKYIVSKKIK